MTFLTNEQARRKIKSIRSLSGFTQAEMADKLGITAKVYSKYENDPYTVPVAKLELVAKIFGCSVGDFFVEDNPTKCRTEE